MKKKKRVWPIVLAMALVLTVSIGLIAYPVVSDWYSERVRSTVQADYVEMIEDQSNEEIRDALAEARAYNESLYAVQTDSSDEQYIYQELLNIGETDIMGYIEVPVIDVMLPIYHTTDDSVLQIGAGHMEGTSLPVGGKNTHTVLSAHSGMSGSRMFSDLDKVSAGDLVILKVLGETLAYEVTGSEVVLPSAVDKIQIEGDKDLVTLITCVPYVVNTHRILVRAERTELTEEEIHVEEATVEVAESTWKSKYVEGILAGGLSAGGFILILFVVWFLRRKKKNKNTQE